MKKGAQLAKRLSPSLSTILNLNASTHSLLSSSPWWSASQHRGVKVNAIHIVESEHKQRGRGGALMQVELRDVDNGNKVSLRFGPEEPVERVFVEEKSFTCLYTEKNTAFLIEPETFDQLQVPLDLFGKSAAYLKEEMKVTLQLYDGRPLTASVPKRVTCTIKETQTPMKGVSATPRYKKALLDNGVTVQVPPYLDTGEEIIISTEDDSYLGRAN
ncbi:Elongation factor P [Gossypium arboreum]|uniref:Elongation factor P n=1 Tax=Gossypium arboreum TaxID=29729 RepID=A0A0B0NM10_GOSAR|nr:Elongation factor P [Gossypium arboreum]